MRALALALLLAASPADSWLGVDKAEHFGVSALLGAGLYLVLANDLHVEPAWKRALIASSVTLSVGVIKELAWDLGTHGGDASWRDFAADALGTGVGVGLTYLVDRLLFGPASVVR